MHKSCTPASKPVLCGTGDWACTLFTAAASVGGVKVPRPTIWNVRLHTGAGVGLSGGSLVWDLWFQILGWLGEPLGGDWGNLGRPLAVPAFKILYKNPLGKPS